MRNLFFIALGATALLWAFAPVPKVYFQNQKGDITFFSSAALEDITAVNHKSSALLKTADGSLTVKVPIRSFEFEKDLMYKHFLQKKYMWADEHPEAEFAGKLTNLADINFDQDGEYAANVAGTLTIRGVSKDYQVNGTIKVVGNKLTCHAKFNVKLADHEVPIPKVVTENIAEVVEVTINLDMEEYAK
ncbi:MAG: YceI family protein [Bacteroidetes bacterium]|jgi:polyisoprenoid-binding protein YceI|nr:YceI family protein [Bacteroidota bacterium]